MDKRKQIEAQANYVRQLHLATFHEEHNKKKAANKEAKKAQAEFRAGKLLQLKKEIGMI